jgi:hypothetical protein
MPAASGAKIAGGISAALVLADEVWKAPTKKQAKPVFWEIYSRPVNGPGA